MNKHFYPQIMLALLMGGSAMACFAGDSKAISTLDCRPLTEAHVNLSFRTRGVTNDAAGSRSVICPITRDQGSAYTDVNYGRVSPWMRTGTSPGSMECTLYHGSALSTTTATVSGSTGTVAANTNKVLQLTIPSTPVGWSQIQMSLVCSMTAKVTLGHIYLEEIGTTDN